MALARNIKTRRTRIKLPKLKRKALLSIVVIAVLLGAYGVLSLSRIMPKVGDKKEIKYETGDQPLPQTTTLWVTADGGLRMRANPDAKAALVSLIPNGTQLTATEIQGDWYKVTYQDKEGWVNKGYVTTQAPAEDPTKNWKVFTNKSFGYSLRYPAEWVAQDYGANPASGSQSYVGFGLQLAPSLDPSLLPPVIVRITGDSQSSVENHYKAASNSIAEAVTVSGLAGTKYIYNAATGVQMTAYVIPKSAQVVIIEESGGYSDELLKIIGTLTLG